MLRVHETGIPARTPLASVLVTRDFALVTLAHFTLFVGMQSLVPTLPLYVEQLGGAGFGCARAALQALVVDRASPARRGAAISAYYRPLTWEWAWGEWCSAWLLEW